ncbi:sodium-independent anion transporter, partial [Citrobacter sp. AAK_AS5]
SDHLLVDFLRALGGIEALQPAAVAFGVGSLAALVGLKRLWPRLPGVPLVGAATIAISAWTGFAAHGGAVVGEVPAGL